jgi:hypothetical protein
MNQSIDGGNTPKRGALMGTDGMVEFDGATCHLVLKKFVMVAS